MEKQSLFEYVKDNLYDMNEGFKTLWIFFICAAILIFITAVLTFLFMFILCLFIPSPTIISILSLLFFLTVLLSLTPIALTVFEYFVDM